MNAISRSMGIIFVVPEGTSEAIVTRVMQQCEPGHEASGLFTDPLAAYNILKGIQDDSYVIITVLNGWARGRSQAFFVIDLLRGDRREQGPRVLFADEVLTHGDRELLAASRCEVLSA